MAIQQIDGGRQVRAGTITDTQIASGAGIADSKLGTSYIKADGTRAYTGNQAMGGFRFTGAGDGVADTDFATVGQLKNFVNGLDQKGSVRTATNGSETYTISGGAITQISGTTISGVTLAVGDEFLSKNAPAASGTGVADVNSQGSNQPANGLYRVTGNTTNLTVVRADRADASSEVTGGLTVWVNEGTAPVGDTQWTLTTDDTITLNTTPLQFTQTDSGAITVNSSLTKNGKQLGRAALTGDVTAAADSNATTIANGAVTLAKQAALAANSVIGNLTGSSATPAAVAATAAATASTVMTRDVNGNVKVNSSARNISTTATAAGTTTLTVGSAQFQQFTGNNTQTVVLPDATTLVTGQSFIISNQSSQAVQVNSNGGSGVRSIAALTTATITLIANAGAAGTWDPGTTAVPTGLTSSNFVNRETPSGSINGSNTAYTLAFTPVTGTENVYLNGLLLEPGAGNDYTISGASITMLYAPSGSGPDKLRVSYQK